MTPNNDQEREAFEAWYELEYMSGLDSAGAWDEARNCYEQLPVHMAWCGYRAGRASMLKASPEQIEEIAHRTAWRYSVEDGTYTFNRSTLLEFVRRVGAAPEVENDEILIAIKRPEEYEDVHPDLVAEDAMLGANAAFEWRVLSTSTNDSSVAAPEVEGWRPIETAPKESIWQDGHNHYGEYFLAWYPGAMRPLRVRWWYRDDSEASNFLADGSWAVFPTVWQPLPVPPSTEDSSGVGTGGKT